jgi:preprotein translocase subunit Sss1
MDPAIWGSCAWRVLHLLAIGYPKQPTYEDIVAYKNFYENFWKVIPCYKCSVNYRRHLKEFPLDDYLKDNKTLFEWTVHLHNIVNTELKKPQMSLEDATKLYRKIIKSSSEKKEVEEGKKMFVWLFLLTVLGIVGYVIYTNESVYNKIRSWFPRK